MTGKLSNAVGMASPTATQPMPQWRTVAS